MARLGYHVPAAAILASLAVACGGSGGSNSGSDGTPDQEDDPVTVPDPLPEVAGACHERALDYSGEATTIEGDGPLDLDALQSRTWTEVEPALVLPPGVPDTVRRHAPGVSFGNTTYRDKTGDILYYESLTDPEHDLADIYADVVASWNLSENWLRIEKMTNWTGSRSSGGELQDDYFDDPTPAPRHTYESFQYIPGQDRVFLILGANTFYRNNLASDETAQAMERDFESTWLYDFENRCWDQNHDMNIRQFWTSDRAWPDWDSRSRWLPSVQKMLVLNNRKNRGALYDPVHESWEIFAEPDDFESNPPVDNTSGLRNASSTWDHKRGRWVFRASDDEEGSVVYYFDPGSLHFHDLPTPPADAGPDRSITYVGAAPDDEPGTYSIDRYLIIGDTKADTWELNPGDPDAGWQHIGGGDADLGDLRHPYLEYDPKSGLVGLLFSGGDGGHFVFKYAD